MEEWKHHNEPFTRCTSDAVVPEPYGDGFFIPPPTNTTGGTPQESVQETIKQPTWRPYIPYGERKGRTLVLCFDGTGDQFDLDNSNIVQLVTTLKKDDIQKQLVYYQAGIGTYTSPAIISPIRSKVARTLDEMLAWNLDAHVMGGYEFLMQKYRLGDKICIFGFSRGAYTARSLAGMLNKVGLLPAENRQQVPFAYKMYSRDDDIGWDQSKAFKKAFSTDVKIEFLGVWDTVDSVGIISKRLPFTASNTIIKTFRHAISLDEHRSKFKPNLWNQPTKEEVEAGINLMHEKRKRLRELRVFGGGNDDHGLNGRKPRLENGNLDASLGSTVVQLDPNSDHEMDLHELLDADGSARKTNVKEVWFAGCHCNIGGGFVKNGTRYSLARIPLRWIIRECFKADTGILFDTHALYDTGLDPFTLWPSVTERPRPLLECARQETIKEHVKMPFTHRLGNLFRTPASKRRAENARKEKEAVRTEPFINEEEEELRDALSPMHDQLKLNRFWWILEILPVSMRYLDLEDAWVSYIGINLGRPREIPNRKEGKLRFHRSVQLRKEAQGKDGEKYTPRARHIVEPEWTD